MPLQISYDLEAIRAFCEKWGITEFGFCGSVIRDDFRPDSDIDVLTRYDRKSRVMFEWEEAEAELKEMFGRKTDIINRGAIEESRNYIRRSLTLFGDRRYTKDQARLFDVMAIAENILWSKKSHSLLKLHGLVNWSYEAHLTRRLHRMASVVTGETRTQLPEIDWQRLDELPTVVSEDGDILNQNELEKFIQDVCPMLQTTIEQFLPRYEQLEANVVDEYVVYRAPQIPAGNRFA